MRVESRNPKTEGRRRSGTRGTASRLRFGFRDSDFLRASDFRFRISLLFLAAQSTFAASTNALDPNAIPPLRPPHAELPPSLWEQHSLLVILCSAGLFLMIGALVWFFVRPKPVVPVPPEAEARRALEPLRQKPEDGALLSRVSQVLRKYIVEAYHLPAEETTTTEFCRMIATDGRLGHELASAAADFLRQCDQRKFSPPVPAPPLSAVDQALGIIERSQARLKVLTLPARGA